MNKRSYWLNLSVTCSAWAKASSLPLDNGAQTQPVLCTDKSVAITARIRATQTQSRGLCIANMVKHYPA